MRTPPAYLTCIHEDFDLSVPIAPGYAKCSNCGSAVNIEYLLHASSGERAEKLKKIREIVK